MDFDKVRLEELKEEILSIEDFDKVDEGLMTEINKNEELCRLFEEMKALSALVGDSAPSPVIDGVTLHDAVMKRIESGDTAPRYIYKRKYPIATAACLLVCMAVVLVLRNGFGGFAEKAAFDSAAPETEALSDTSENGAVDYKVELFSLDDVADEEAPLTADSVKFKSATVTADNAEFQAAPTEAVHEAEELEAATESSISFDGGKNIAVYDKSDSTSHRVSGGGGAVSGGSSGGTASGGSVMLSKSYGDTQYTEIITAEPARSDVFVFEDKAYTVSEVFEMYKEGTLDFDINADIYDEVWAVLLESFAVCVDEQELELSEFVSDNYKKSLE